MNNKYFTPITELPGDSGKSESAAAMAQYARSTSPHKYSNAQTKKSENNEYFQKIITVEQSRNDLFTPLSQQQQIKKSALHTQSNKYANSFSNKYAPQKSTIIQKSMSSSMRKKSKTIKKANWWDEFYDYIKNLSPDDIVQAMDKLIEETNTAITAMPTPPATFNRNRYVKEQMMDNFHRFAEMYGQELASGTPGVNTQVFEALKQLSEQYDAYKKGLPRGTNTDIPGLSRALGIKDFSATPFRAGTTPDMVQNSLEQLLGQINDAIISSTQSPLGLRTISAPNIELRTNPYGNRVAVQKPITTTGGTTGGTTGRGRSRTRDESIAEQFGFDIVNQLMGNVKGRMLNPASDVEYAITGKPQGWFSGRPTSSTYQTARTYSRPGSVQLDVIDQNARQWIQDLTNNPHDSNLQIKYTTDSAGNVVFSPIKSQPSGIRDVIAILDEIERTASSTTHQKDIDVALAGKKALIDAQNNAQVGGNDTRKTWKKLGRTMGLIGLTGAATLGGKALWDWYNSDSDNANNTNSKEPEKYTVTPTTIPMTPTSTAVSNLVTPTPTSKPKSDTSFMP